MTEIVKHYPSTITLAINKKRCHYGRTVMLTAMVASPAPSQPTGAVTFKKGMTSLGSASLNSSGVATVIKTNIAAGSDSITATFSGDAETATSTSAPVKLIVEPAVTGMTLTSWPNPSESGQSVKFTATLTSSGSLPNGQTVTFSRKNGTILGTATIYAGKAALSTAVLSPGPHHITATYPGNSDYTPTSATVMQTVN